MAPQKILEWVDDSKVLNANCDTEFSSLPENIIVDIVVNILYTC